MNTTLGELSDLEFLDPVADLIAIQAVHTSGFGFVSSAALERLHNQRPFELFEVDAGGGKGRLLRQPD
jgi:hypothetical protein